MADGRRTDGRSGERKRGKKNGAFLLGDDGHRTMSERTHRRTSGRATEGGRDGLPTSGAIPRRARGHCSCPNRSRRRRRRTAMVTAQAFPPSRPTTRCKPIVVVVDVVIAVTAIRNGPIVRVCGATAKGRERWQGKGRRDAVQNRRGRRQRWPPCSAYDGFLMGWLEDYVLQFTNGPFARRGREPQVGAP